MIVAYLTEKRKRLTERDKFLSPYFVEVYIDFLQASVPFLSIRAFRERDIFDGQSIEKTFLSSGSTQTKRAKHHFSFDGLMHYARGAVEGWFHYANTAGFPTSVTIFSLVPSCEEWPQSSLAAMIDMFAHRGLRICYVNPQTIAKKIAEDLLTNMQIVIFGTSFHFIELQAVLKDNPILADEKQVFIVDTGGTKGRTESYSAADFSELITSYFSPKTHLHFHSEYGMCELASQAYGTTKDEFLCNPCLQVFAIQPTLSQESATDTAGFLAFIDENNFDSYPAILTEDLGMIVGESQQRFRLLGRAPDAAVKGCSLRVSPQFTFAKNELVFPSNSQPINRSQSVSPFSASTILDSLPAVPWDEFSKNDLKKSLQDWEQPTDFSNPKLVGQKAGIIASANIPITWLYPTRYLNDAGIAEVHLFLPSIRPDDLLSTYIRQQIETLADAVAPQLNCQLVLHSEKMSREALATLNPLLVFGQDDTVALYQKQFGSQVIGFGDVLNSYHVNQDDNYKSLVELCSTWFGRGCLTPTLLWLDESQAEKFSAQEFSRHLSSLLRRRFEATGLLNSAPGQTILETFHVFDTIDMRAQFFAADLKNGDERIVRQTPVTVVDLRGDVPNHLNLDWQNGGSGFVYLADARQKDDVRFKAFSVYDPSPTLHSPHCGKTWTAFLSRSRL